MVLTWEDCRAVFQPDGALRDIYVQGTTEDDWDAILAFVDAQGFSAAYTRNGIAGPLPRDVAKVFADRQASHLLRFDIGGGVHIHGYFFEPYEIEMDIDPKEIRSEKELEPLVRFLRGIGDLLSKDVLLTEESAIEHIYLTYFSQTKSFSLTPAHQ